jgi:hypothetical protein
VQRSVEKSIKKAIKLRGRITLRESARSPRLMNGSLIELLIDAAAVAAAAR